ncbi:MAG: hypothetical protein ACRDMZ_13020, partial [Solirubrobacteraceae bacterium]
MALLGELLAATAHAHSPRTLVRALATAIAARAPIVRLELRTPACTATAALCDGEWRAVEGERQASAAERGAAPGANDDGAAEARSIATGLAVVPSAPLPALFERAEVREALSQVV